MASNQSVELENKSVVNLETQKITYILSDDQGVPGKLQANNLDSARDEAVEEIREWYGTDCEGNPRTAICDDCHLYAIPTAKITNPEACWSFRTDIFPDLDDGDAWELLEQYEIDLGFSEVQPKDPEADHTHKWDSVCEIEGGLKENPGIQGHGAGIIATYHCTHPGCYLTMTCDTWDQNPSNGRQGVETTTYGELDNEDKAKHAEIYQEADN